MCLAAFKKNNHFCSWCSALPSTTLKLGVAGVMYVIYVVVCGWLFFWKNPGRDFLFGVLFRAVDVHVNVMLIITHTHIPIVKAYARGFCDNSTKVDAKRHHQLLGGGNYATSFIVQKYRCRICDNRTKEDSKGNHQRLKLTQPHLNTYFVSYVTTPQRWMLRATITIVHKYLSAICDNPRKVDAKGHHHLLKSNKPHCPQFVTTPQRWMLRATITIVHKYLSAICDNPRKVDAKGHHHLLKSNKPHCPQFVTTPQRWMLRATITIVQKYVSAICDNPTKVDAKGHHHHCPQIFVCNM